MADAARNEEPANDTVEVPREDFARLVRALERLVTVEERKLAAKGAVARRAAKEAGPTTEEHIAYVRKKLRKFGSR